MNTAQPIFDEKWRLEALRGYAVLDTPQEQAFDDLATLAARICETEVASISLLDEQRQWFKAKVGFDVPETPRELSFCAQMLDSPELFVVPDARQDSRFSHYPNVISEPGVRFYAGAPLVTPEGAVLGALCVVDYAPRAALSPVQEQTLRVLAQQVMAHLELRRHTRELAQSEHMLRAIIDAEPESVQVMARDGALRMMNPAGLEMIEADSFAEVAGQSLYSWVEEEDRPALEDLAGRVFDGESGSLQFRVTGRKGSRRWLELHAAPLRDERGDVTALLSVMRDVTARHRAEIAISRLAGIVEASVDAIIGYDLSGTILNWNRGAEKIFGYTAAEMIGSSITVLIPPALQDEAQNTLQKIKLGETVDRFETLRQAKDGRRIDISVTAAPIQDAAGRVVGASVIMRNIHLVKLREREVERLSRLYAALSQVNQAIVCSTAREELFQKISQALVEQGGFAMAWIGKPSLDGKSIQPAAWWGDISGYLKTVNISTQDCPAGRGPVGTAYRENRHFICNDALRDPIMAPWRGEMEGRGLRACAAFPVRLDGLPCGVLAVYAEEVGFFMDKEIALLAEAAADISFALDNLAREEWRRQAEDAARREKLFSDAMIESMPGILYFYDDAGRFLRWNRNLELVTGYTPSEIRKMNPLDFFRSQEKQPVEDRIVEVFATGESFVEASLLTKDGRAIPYFFTGRRIVVDNLAYLVGVGIDLSERERAEQALRDLNETLEIKVAERTEELRSALVRAESADRIKSAFLATMSHELRTPLNSIIGFTGVVLQELAGPLNEEQSKQLGIVRSSARHLLELINDVLDLSKIEAGQLEVRTGIFDLRTSLERVAAVVKPMADAKQLELVVRAAPGLGEMESDQRRVEQILLNLLNNAIKFTEKGRVTLLAERLDEWALPKGNSRRGAAARLCVSDTGMGIHPEDLATLFQPFRQLDAGLARQHDGTGLGLAICRRLATLLGGEIVATSEWERGSDFTVTLPI